MVYVCFPIMKYLHLVCQQAPQWWDGRLWAGDDGMSRETGCWGGAGDDGRGCSDDPSPRCFRGACRDILLLGKRNGLSS